MTEKEIDFNQPPTVTDMGGGRVWPGVAQISGFGGSYEDQCRKMLRAGIAWLEANPDNDPKFSTYAGVFGIVNAENDDAKALAKAIVDGDNDVTGAMVQAVTAACMFVRRNGWDKYCTAMLERENDEARN